MDRGGNYQWVRALVHQHIYMLSVLEIDSLDSDCNSRLTDLHTLLNQGPKVILWPVRTTRYEATSMNEDDHWQQSCHPASSTLCRYSDVERQAVGIAKLEVLMFKGMLYQ